MIINIITTILNFRFPLFFSIKPNRTIGLFCCKLPLLNGVLGYHNSSISIAQDNFFNGKRIVGKDVGKDFQLKMYNS